MLVHLKETKDRLALRQGVYDIRCFWPKKHAFRILVCGAAIFRQSFLEF